MLSAGCSANAQLTATGKARRGTNIDTEELIELYYDAYNPDTATRQQLKSFNDMTTSVIGKAAGAQPVASGGSN